MSNQNMANREVADLIFYDYKTKKPFLNLDFANVTTTELTGETTFAYGGQGHPKRIAFNGERGGTLTIETQLQSVKLWELITGGDVSKTAQFVVREELTASTGKVTLSDTPVTGSVVVYKADDDCGTVVASTVSSKEATLTGVTNENVIVYYLKELSSKVERISIKSTSFPKAFIVYGDTIMKTENEEILPYKMIVAKAQPQGNLSLSYSNTGDPATITITCDMLVNQDDEMLDLILIDED